MNMVFTNELETQPSMKSQVLHAAAIFGIAAGVVMLAVGMHTAGGGVIAVVGAGHLLVVALVMIARRLHNSQKGGAQ